MAAFHPRSSKCSSVLLVFLFWWVRMAQGEVYPLISILYIWIPRALMPALPEIRSSYSLPKLITLESAKGSKGSLVLHWTRGLNLQHSTTGRKRLWMEQKDAPSSSLWFLPSSVAKSVGGCNLLFPTHSSTWWDTVSLILFTWKTSLLCPDAKTPAAYLKTGLPLGWSEFCWYQLCISLNSIKAFFIRLVSSLLHHPGLPVFFLSEWNLKLVSSKLSTGGSRCL